MKMNTISKAPETEHTINMWKICIRMETSHIIFRFFCVCHATDLYKSICLVRASVSAQFLHVSVSLMWNSLANLQNEVMLLELTFYFVWMRVCAFLKPIFLHSFHTRTEFICRRCDHIVFICIFFFISMFRTLLDGNAHVSLSSMLFHFGFGFV